MLSQPHRLTKKKDFDLVFQEGRGIKSGFLLFKVHKNHLSVCRFGFVVSKKVSPQSTARNKVKRRMRAIVAKKMPQYPGHFDVVVTALPGSTKAEFLEFEKAIDQFFKKLT